MNNQGGDTKLVSSKESTTNNSLHSFEPKTPLAKVVRVLDPNVKTLPSLIRMVCYNRELLALEEICCVTQSNPLFLEAENGFIFSILVWLLSSMLPF